MKDPDEALREQMLTLEADLDAVGWDQPSAIYVVEDTGNDPHLIKAFDFKEHPCDVLDILPPLVTPRAKGVILANEAWMLTVDADERSFAEALAQGSPAQHPDRVEARFLHCMMRNGDWCALVRKRGQEPYFMSDATTLGGRVYEAMKRLCSVKEDA